MTSIAYTLIKGEFHIHYPHDAENGPQPDGDTLKFRPYQPDLIECLPQPGDPPDFSEINGQKMINVRFEGIDALELHFKNFHQHEALARESRDVLLDRAGFGSVEFHQDSFTVNSVENHPIPGYIFSNGLDSHGRVIAFVFTDNDTSDDTDGTSFESFGIPRSLNVTMSEQGHAYPAFYSSLPTDLREYLKDIAVKARDSGIGLWSKDATMGATISGPDQLQTLAIWPKLFRRLVSFYQDEHTDLANFDKWLRADPDNRNDRLLLPHRQLGNMHDIVRVDGTTISLLHYPQDIVIVPNDYGSIRIICALVNPTGQSERGKETVTILNTTNEDINLQGFCIENNNGRQDLGGVLASGETQRVPLGNDIQLGNAGNTITIVDDTNEGNPDKIIDQVSYESQELPREGYTKVF